jgi:hypothetical protein
MMINDKRGIIRIIEAFISILLILGATTIIFTKVGQKDYESENIANTEKAILSLIANNPSLRNQVVTAQKSGEDYLVSQELSEFVALRIPPSYEYEIVICELKQICSASQYHEVVHAQERAISSTLDNYAPKKVKIYVWREEIK